MIEAEGHNLWTLGLDTRFFSLSLIPNIWTCNESRFSFSPQPTSGLRNGGVGKGRHSTMTRSHPSEQRKAKLRLNLWKIHHNQPRKGKASCGQLKNLRVPKCFPSFSTSGLIPCDGFISARVFKFRRRQELGRPSMAGIFYDFRWCLAIIYCAIHSRALSSPSIYMQNGNYIRHLIHSGGKAGEKRPQAWKQTLRPSVVS